MTAGRVFAIALKLSAAYGRKIFEKSRFGKLQNNKRRKMCLIISATRSLMGKIYLERLATVKR